MRPETLEIALRQSWDQKTCYPPLRYRWTPDSPALGQCAVSALVVQDFFGGDLLFCRHQNHYWNRLPTQNEVDFTKIQFPAGTLFCQDSLASRRDTLFSWDALKASTPFRYLLLKRRVVEKLKVLRIETY